ncbi:MAG TPA: tripartite tricarboxylate transporter substrate binding protein [Burkholderiales bacterium]|nr:tripartite tricarboxylate transporter substrate binding protein [Burkholderiales bacterium]
MFSASLFKAGRPSVFTRFVAAALATAAISATAGAGTYPEKPIRLVVAAAPGGASELLARTIAPRMSAAWGQPVIVDHRPGAGGTIGTNVVAKARPDGHTLLIGSIGNLVIASGVYPNLPYDANRDFAPVTNLVNQPIVLVAHPSFEPNTVRELVAYARARPGQVVYASTGIGSAMHLGGELLQKNAGLQLVHVPYKGGGPAVVDLVGGHVPLLFVGLAPALPHIRSGKIKAIAAIGSHRAAVLPDTPTVGETLPGYKVDYWSGVLAPARTPPAIVSKLNGEIVRYVQTPGVRKRLEDAGFEVLATTPQQFAGTIREELVRWGGIVRSAAIKPE